MELYTPLKMRHNYTKSTERKLYCSYSSKRNKKNPSCKCLRKYIFTNGFILGLPFAKLLRNFCGTKRKIFLYLWIIFARKKNNNLRIHLQKSFRAKLSCSAFAKLKNSSIPQLEFCAIPQFRKNQTVGDDVCVSQNSILEKSCFGMSSYWSLLLTNDS